MGETRDTVYSFFNNFSHISKINILRKVGILDEKNLPETTKDFCDIIANNKDKMGDLKKEIDGKK